jgi:hypothetical protein
MLFTHDQIAARAAWPATTHIDAYLTAQNPSTTHHFIDDTAYHVSSRDLTSSR